MFSIVKLQLSLDNWPPIIDNFTASILRLKYFRSKYPDNWHFCWQYDKVY